MTYEQLYAILKMIFYDKQKISMTEKSLPSHVEALRRRAKKTSGGWLGRVGSIAYWVRRGQRVA